MGPRRPDDDAAPPAAAVGACCSSSPGSQMPRLESQRVLRTAAVGRPPPQYDPHGQDGRKHARDGQDQFLLQFPSRRAAVVALGAHYFVVVGSGGERDWLGGWMVHAEREGRQTRRGPTTKTKRRRSRRAFFVNEPWLVHYFGRSPRTPSHFPALPLPR